MAWTGNWSTIFNIMDNKQKLIVILGPTASGKTKLAVELARQINGEIISADSRQVYRGMDVGTGKDLAEYGEVKYHLIDVADPETQFTVADFKKQAGQAITDIHSRGSVPMLVGGSGLYLQAVVENFALEISDGADEELRAELELLTVEALYDRLLKNSPAFAKRLNDSDKKNKRRLIRYLEIEQPGRLQQPASGLVKYDVLILGLMPDKELMESKIKRRLIERLEKEDMIGEVAGLRQQSVTDERLKAFGLEYRFVTDFLNEKFSYDELIERLYTAIRQFAKRQITWFRRWERQGREISWVENIDQARVLIDKFLQK